MRLSTFVLGSTLAVLAVHCQSEVPEKPEAEVVEGRPGTLVITTPARAAFIEGDGDLVEVRGTGATSGLQINGEKAEVADDGSFHATVKPANGLNLIVATDGEARLETPFLYGHFVAAGTPVAHAIGVDVGALGVGAPAPSASLTSVANLALNERDLFAAVKGQAFSGTYTGVTWKFEVKSGQNGAAKIALTSVDHGISVDASLADISIDGRLEMTALGLTYARDVRIMATSAAIKGALQLDVDADKGALKVAMPDAEPKLEGFKFDTDNAGFPCCVDAIITTFMKPKIEQMARDGLREELPKVLALTLEGLPIPKELDLSMIGLTKPLAINTRFDGSDFDQTGGTITASALFGGAPPAGSPGAGAPGWLSLGGPYARGTRAPSLGATISLDAVNQAMFALWGPGGLSFTVPAPMNAKLSPALPPVVTIVDDKTLRVGLGEIRLTRDTSPDPIAAVTIIQDVAPSGDRDAIVLTPKGEPTISITWLTDDIAMSGKNLVANAAKDQLQNFLKPFRIPVPKFALDALGGGFVGQSLALQTASFKNDVKTGRVSVFGAMRFEK